jgi:Alg9-like mannosyltransferase family
VRSALLATAAVAIDVLIVGCLLVIAYIIFSGGGVFDVAGVRVSARSTGNPVAWTLALAAVRYWLLRTVPFVGIAALGIDALEAASLNGWRRLRLTLSTLAVRRAALVVTAVGALSLAVRLLNASSSYGFFSGDDVEIHEMTFATLFHLDWPIWELRSPFYPMLFIYPVQWAAAQAGFTDTASLVFVGRAVVAVFSTLTLLLLFVIGRRWFGLPVAILAVIFLGISSLHVTFGSSELPRPVAAFFVLGAFGCLRFRTGAYSAASGALLGIAAAMRFSEAMFLLPASIEVVLDKRWKDVFFMTAGFLVTTVVIFGIGDWQYWGSPFYSLINAVDYTVVRRLSSRGYQPFHYYLTHASEWTNYFSLSLALIAAAFRFWRPTLWWLLPTIVLSFLPHKEPRYLIPALPFLALCAGYGLWEMSQRLERMRLVNARRVALVLWVGVFTAIAFELGGFRFRRTDDDVDLARRLSGDWHREGVAIESPWRIGGRLYFPRAPAVVLAVDRESLSEDSYLQTLASDRTVGWVLLISDGLEDRVVDVLTMHGYREGNGDGSRYRVFHRSASSLPGVR